MGMIKLGAHELTAALQALPDSNITPMEEPGVLGNETMPHLTDHKSDYGKSLPAVRGAAPTPTRIKPPAFRRLAMRRRRE